MKTVFCVVLLSLVLSCATLSTASRLDRSLKQSASVTSNAACTATDGNCQATSTVSTQAIDDVERNLVVAIDTAFTSVNGNGNATAAAQTFARSVATAFARIISSHELSVSVQGEGSACARTRSNAQAHAESISTAVSGAFARAANSRVRAAASCFSRVVSQASVTAIQNVEFGSCTNYGHEYLYARIETTAFVRTVAEAFGRVIAAVRNNDSVAIESCGTRTSASTGTTQSSG